MQLDRDPDKYESKRSSQVDVVHDGGHQLTYLTCCGSIQRCKADTSVQPQIMQVFVLLEPPVVTLAVKIL